MQTYAGLFRRVMASVIDYSVIFLLLSFIQFILGIEDEAFLCPDYSVFLELFCLSGQFIKSGDSWQTCNEYCCN